MEETRITGPSSILIVGDIITLALVTVIGFSTHGTLGSAGMRILATFGPLTLAWFAVGPLMGVYRSDRVLNPAWIWLPVWAILIASPLAAWLRAVILNAPIQPLFVLILGGVAALSILIWRGLFYLFSVRRSRSNG